MLHILFWPLYPCNLVPTMEKKLSFESCIYPSGLHALATTLLDRGRLCFSRLHLPLWPPAHCNTCSTMKYFLYSVVASTSLAAMPLQQGLSPVVSSCIVCCIYLS